MVKNPPASSGDTGSSPGPGRSYMPLSNYAGVPQLLSLRSRAREPQLLSLRSRAREPQLLSLRSRAREPQLLKPVCLGPVLCNKRSHCDEKPTHRNEEQPPLAATREKPVHSNKDPTQPKINYF